MSAQLRRAITATLLMFAAAALAIALTPTRHFAQLSGELRLDAAIPHSFGEWREDVRQSAAVINPQQAAFVASIYTETLSRTYVDGHGNRVMLSIAYGEDLSRGRGVHYPEVCYPAQGFQIVESRTGTLSVAGRQLPVKQMVAKQGERIEPLTYWIMVGEQASRGGNDQKLAQLRYRIHGVIPDGLIFRVSSIDRDSAAAYRLQRAFLDALIPALSARSSARIAGTVKPGLPGKP